MINLVIDRLVYLQVVRMEGEEEEEEAEEEEEEIVSKMLLA